MLVVLSGSLCERRLRHDVRKSTGCSRRDHARTRRVSADGSAGRLCCCVRARAMNRVAVRWAVRSCHDLRGHHGSALGPERRPRRTGPVPAAHAEGHRGRAQPPERQTGPQRTGSVSIHAAVNTHSLSVLHEHCRHVSRTWFYHVIQAREQAAVISFCFSRWSCIWHHYSRGAPPRCRACDDVIVLLSSSKLNSTSINLFIYLWLMKPQYNYLIANTCWKWHHSVMCGTVCILNVFNIALWNYILADGFHWLTLWLFPSY